MDTEQPGPQDPCTERGPGDRQWAQQRSYRAVRGDGKGKMRRTWNRTWMIMEKKRQRENERQSGKKMDGMRWNQNKRERNRIWRRKREKETHYLEM